MKYKKGTQEMLDAAKNDATLLPFDTVFVTGDTADSLPHGFNVIRSKSKHACNKNCIAGFKLMNSESIFHFYTFDLLPAKKPKPKKWQNGTQAQLDAAKDDALLIPKKTYFMSRYGATDGCKVYRIDSPHNESRQVMMFEDNGEFDYHNSEDLEPIND